MNSEYRAMFISLQSIDLHQTENGNSETEPQKACIPILSVFGDNSGYKFFDLIKDEEIKEAITQEKVHREYLIIQKSDVKSLRHKAL